MLRIEHYTKYYSEKPAVEDLSLHIQKGEIYGFIGHNGAGKTTTLKSCCGILGFEGGEIYINGQSIRENPLACKSQIAYIPDDPELYGFMSGIKYLHFVADVYGVDKSVRAERIENLAGQFSILKDLASPIATYSHGMKQKLAIVAAFLHTPRLILMDEPFVGLDPKASVTLRGFMKELCDQGGAILFSTHVLEVAEKLSNRVSIIKDGVLLKTGDMSQVVKEGKTLEDIFMEVAADA